MGNQKATRLKKKKGPGIDFKVRYKVSLKLSFLPNCISSSSSSAFEYGIECYNWLIHGNVVQRVKSKVGKKLPRADNFTRTDFKAKGKQRVSGRLSAPLSHKVLQRSGTTTCCLVLVSRSCMYRPNHIMIGATVVVVVVLHHRTSVIGNLGTSLNFFSPIAALHLPDQSVAASKGTAVTSRNLSLQELLAQASHYNAHSRKGAHPARSQHCSC